MVMERQNCPHCIANLNQALMQGFIHDFQILQNGVILHSVFQTEYELDFINTSVKSCLSCKTSLYLIVTAEGVRGTAIEFWDVWHD